MDHFVTVREERYRLVIEEKYEYYTVPPQEDPVKIMLENFGKRAKEKAFADYRKQNHNQQVGHKGPHLPATAVNQGHFHQANMRNQVPPLKKHSGIMDCNEAAKLFGGVVITDYGRNKFTLRA